MYIEYDCVHIRFKQLGHAFLVQFPLNLFVEHYRFLNSCHNMSVIHYFLKATHKKDK